MLDALRDPNEREIWQSFVTQFGPIIHGVVMHVGVPRRDADDVVQETLLEFVQSMRSGKYERGRGRMRQYLRGIARHRAIDALRRLKHEPRGGGDTVIGGLGDEQEFNAAWDREDQHVLSVRALDELKATSRAADANLRAFELIVQRGLPAEDVARECGLSVEQVYVAKSRLSARFREIYERLRHDFYNDA
jgi:RNA polymerase sigma-70 factor (ECF subfamily)